jgi:hypothetical protein
MTASILFDDVQSWIVAGGVLVLLVVTLQMRRYRRRLKAKRHDGSEAEQEPEGGP